MKFLIISAAFIFCICTATTYGDAKPTPVFVPPQMAKAQVDRDESFRVTIENKTSGKVSISTDKGLTWTMIGTVLSPISALRTIHDSEFTASDWGYVGSITATAVNAIHIKVAHPGKHARIFSLLPLELYDPDGFQTTYRDNPSSIFLDIPGGTSIFNGRWSVRLGDPLFTVSGNEWIPWNDQDTPTVGETFGIIAKMPPTPQWMIEIENVKNGQVLFSTANGALVPIARVVQPFTGSGRFLGTLFQDTGRVRANHPGVIDISTSPFGVQGGIQIVPYFHSKAPNLAYVHHSGAYMVVAGINGESLEGRAPLFMDYIRPGDTVTALVNGEWVAFPESVGKDLMALQQVKAIRIVPSTRFIDFVTAR